MNGTSSGSGLQARLQKRAEQDRQEIEALTQSELKKLAKNLRQSVNDEMYIIVRDIKDHTRWMNAALWRPWLRSVTVGVCLFLGILAGSWGLTRWYANQIQSLIETRAALEFEIQEARQTIERLKETTWGVVLHEEEQGRKFVVLPKGTLDYPPWTVGGRPCRAAIERVKEFYDRARTAVDDRLDRAVGAVRAGTEAASRAGRGFAGADAAARRSGQGLEAAARADRSAGRGLEAAGRNLGSELQEDRRSIARGVNAIWKQQQQARERQRGPERDYGPSR